MSLFTDMLGLFKNEKKGLIVNSSLQQGNNFNDMQNAISSSVIPQLPLIERTTQENLGSVVENFSNSETPLAKVNEREYKMITKTEDNFNKAISNLSRKHKALLLDPPKAGMYMVDWGGNHLMTNCDDYTSTVGPYKSKSGEYLAEACHSGVEGVDCNKHYAGSESQKDWQRIACRTGKELQESRSKKPQSINNQLSGLYNEVNKKASVLQNQMHSLHAQQQSLTSKKGKTTNTRGTLGDKLELLQQKENKIRKLEQGGDTLAGELEDNNLQVNSQQLRYMVWFVAAVTLGLVAAKKATQ
jgi:hypothetical protein